MRQPISHHRSLLLSVGVLIIVAAAFPVRAWLISNSPDPVQGTGYEVVVGETPVNGTSPKQLVVKCPVGKKATGAGWSVLDPTSSILEGESTYSEPAFDGGSWMVNAKNRSTFAPNWKLRIRLICAVIKS